MKSHRLILGSILLIVSLLGAARLQAQTTAFIYQGHLTENGAPAQGAQDLTFTLYDAASGGATVGTSNVAHDLAISNGLFTVSLDFGAGAFDGSARWLEVAVRPGASSGAYTVVLPRQPITATPYAITAGNVTGVVGSGSLSGTYSGAVTLNNPGNSFNGAFAGNGANLTNVNAATLGGLNSSNFWRLGGNNVSAGQFIGSTNNEAVELRVNGVRALRLEPTVNDASHSNIVNVVNGSPLNFVAPGVYGATIGGGAGSYGGLTYSNTVTADFGTVSGGYQNTARGPSATVGGGEENTASGQSATVGGGIQNTASNQYATVGGGGGNFATLPFATVGGGEVNTASGLHATVGGGKENTASGFQATVGGGERNISSGFGATVPGGFFNTAGGQSSFAAGNRANANHDGTFVWADSTFANLASSGPDQFLIRASGGVGIGTNNPATALHVHGTVTATALSGGGAGLTSLNGTNISTNTITAAQIADGSILNADINAAAGIVDTKLATISTPGKVADSALSTNVTLLGSRIESFEITDGTIFNADIHDFAAIADTKLATISTFGKVADTALSANVTLLGSSVESSEIADGTIVNADINPAAGIWDTKLATIATPGKVADSALSANVPLLSGGKLSDSVLSANVSLLGSTIASSEITDDTIVNADISAGAAIADTKLATIATAGKVSDSALSANVALRSGNNTFTGNQNFTGGGAVITLDNTADIYARNSSGVVEGLLTGRWADNGTYLTYGTGGFIVRNNANDYNMVIQNGGNVGIGTTTPGYKLEVNGTAHRVDNSANWTVASDRRYKRDITPLTNSLAVLEQLRPSRFHYNEDYVREHPATTDKERVGFVAQEYEQVFPDYVTRNADGYLSVDISPVTFHNTEAIRELNQKLKEQKAENAELKARLEKLERVLEKKGNRR